VNSEKYGQKEKLEAQQRMRSETITEQLSVANKVHDTEK
jgi:hypothetical protein